MSETPTNNFRGAIWALAGFGVYATHDALIKALGQDYSPFQILFTSMLMSFPLITLMLIRDRTPGTLRPVHPWWVLLRSVAGIFNFGAAFYAFSVLPLAQVYAFIFAAPLLITMLAIPILGEKVGLHRLAAVLVGLVGVLIVLRPGSGEFGPGHIAGLMASVGSAVNSIISRKIGREERSAVLLLYPLIATFVAMAIVMPASYRPMELGGLALCALVAGLSFAGSIMMLNAYRNGVAAVVAPMHYSQIIWATGFGLFFFDEVPDQATMLGIAVLIASGLYIVLREAMGPSRQRPVTTTQRRTDAAPMPSMPPVLKRFAEPADSGAEPLAKARGAK